MQTITISGGLGRDSELRQTQSGDDVLSFSVGVSQGHGDRKSTNWFRCNVWGKRARTLQQYLLKGVKVVVQGELTIGEYQGKPQYDVRAGEVDFMSRGDNQRREEPSRDRAPAHRDDLDDDVPF